MNALPRALWAPRYIDPFIVAVDYLNRRLDCGPVVMSAIAFCWFESGLSENHPIAD